jgi:hypothetical protein
LAASLEGILAAPEWGVKAQRILAAPEWGVKAQKSVFFRCSKLGRVGVSQRYQIEKRTIALTVAAHNDRFLGKVCSAIRKRTLAFASVNDLEGSILVLEITEIER